MLHWNPLARTQKRQKTPKIVEGRVHHRVNARRSKPTPAYL
jgi:hypothetical protein